MNKLKCFALSCSVITLFGVLCVTIADNPPSVTVCEKYLNYSDSQFKALVAVSSNNAKIIAAQLSNCLQSNICSNISNANDCAATLASRTFLSNFYANYTSKGGYDAPMPPPSTSGYNYPPPPPASSYSGGGANNTANAVSSNAPAPNNKSTSTSVHWY